LFHVLNGSATEIRSLALPGHTFKVVALDGNPVPAPLEVPVLWLGTAERIEYAGQSGKPQWIKPKPFHWNYARFGKPNSGSKLPAPDETIDMLFFKRNAAREGFNEWTINDVAFSMDKPTPAFHLTQGRRYRLRMRNASDDIHQIHLHRHSFELTKLAGQSTAGVVKDVVMVGGYQEVEVDFTADNPGLTLFHCHQQLHMDFGFMALFDYV
jgi:FtsP/CotA-like multicopper oxidase with cupredoxin domain